MAKVRYAIVGVRNFAGSHYKRVRQAEAQGEIELVAIVVTDQKKNAARVAELKAEGLTIYDSYEVFLAEAKDSVDVVCLPISIGTHGELAAKAMQAGYDVILEKPPVSTVDELDWLCEVQKETGRFCSVGFQFMHSSTIHQLKRMLLDGSLGKLEYITTRGYWPRLDSYYNRNPWAGRVIHRGRVVLDGPVTNALAHYLQNMTFLAGTEFAKDATLKTVRAELYRGHKSIQSDDTTCMELITKEGVGIYFYVTHRSDINYGPVMEIHTDQALITWTNDEKCTIKFKNGEEKTLDNEGIDPYLQVFNVPAQVKLGKLDGLYSTFENTRSFVVAVNGMYLSSEQIREIPAKYITESKNGKGDVKTECADIVKFMDQACAQRKLLSDIGVEWAVPTKAVNVENLTDFNPFK